VLQSVANNSSGKFAKSPEVTRVVGGFVWPIEAPALRFLLKRMPSWCMPNHLTALGVAGAALAFVGYALTSIDLAFIWLATLGVVLNWFGDSLDGQLARHRHICRNRFGFYLDHMSDLYSQMLITIGIGLTAFVDMEYALLMQAAYLAIMVHAMVALHTQGELRIAYFSLGPTEARLLTIGFNALVLVIPHDTIIRLGELEMNTPEALIGSAAILLSVITLIATWRTAVRLAAEDPAP